MYTFVAGLWSVMEDYAQVYDGGMNSGQLADQLRQLNGRMEWRIRAVQRSAR